LTRIIRYALPIVLMLAVEPTAASARSVACHAVGRGESATQVARRLTGDGWNAYRPWFQIMNSSSRFIPKSQYNRIRAGWRACVIKSIESTPAGAMRVAEREGPGVLETPAVSVAPDDAGAPEALLEPVVLAAAGAVAVVGDRPPTETSGVLRAIRGIDLTFVWLSAAIALPWFSWRIVDHQLTRRKTTSIVMRHFAKRFVHEFERPLAWDDAERPVRMRVRYSPRRGRLDILLAPGTGRRYPNLADHKKNVEYDVTRVVHALADRSFTCGPLSAQGEWVVVPFRFEAVPTRRAFGAPAGHEQPGVTCISSF
jgi:hypothetical protein